MTSLLIINGSFNKEFYNKGRILTSHLRSCYIDDDCYDSFPEVSAGQDQGDAEKAEPIKGNNKKTCDKVKKIHCGIATWDRTKQASIHHRSS